MIPTLYLGGLLAQFGWVFVGFGLIFVWAFTLNADIASLWQFSGQLETVNGYVEHVSETKISEGGGEHSKGTPVYEIHFRFEYPQGAQQQGVCYRTGWNPSPNEKVDVEFPKDKPDISRIVGTRRKPMGLFGLIPVIFPAIGFAMVMAGLVRGRKAHRLLRDGRLAAGALVAKEATNTRVNNQTVYRLSFEFQDDSGQRHTASARTHRPRTLEDNDSELLLYDENQPSKAVMMDNLPGSPRIDSQGYLRGRSRRAVLCMLLPVIVIVGHTIAAIILF